MDSARTGRRFSLSPGRFEPLAEPRDASPVPLHSERRVKATGSRGRSRREHADDAPRRARPRPRARGRLPDAQPALAVAGCRFGTVEPRECLLGAIRERRRALSPHASISKMAEGSISTTTGIATTSGGPPRARRRPPPADAAPTDSKPSPHPKMATTISTTSVRPAGRAPSTPPRRTCSTPRPPRHPPGATPGSHPRWDATPTSG